MEEYDNNKTKEYYYDKYDSHEATAIQKHLNDEGSVDDACGDLYDEPHGNEVLFSCRCQSESRKVGEKRQEEGS